MLFVSLLRSLCGKMSQEIIGKLETVIKKTLSCWRNLRLSTNIVKIHGIEDHLLDPFNKCNGIEYFTEDFIEQANYFGIID